MTNGPEQPHSGSEFPPPAGSPPAGDPYPYPAVDYPNDPGLPPPVHPDGHVPPGYAPPPPYTPPGYAGPGYAVPPGYSGPPEYPAPYTGGYGYGPDPYDPYRPAKPFGTNGKAIAALTTSLVGLVFCGVPSIVGLILGIVAMRETRRTGQDGYGLALAGVIVGGLVTAGFVLYVLFVIGIAASGWSAV